MFRVFTATTEGVALKAWSSSDNGSWGLVSRPVAVAGDGVNLFLSLLL